MELKRCSRCKEMKVMEKDFYPHGYTVDGYSHTCRACQGKDSKARQEREKRLDELNKQRLASMKQEWE